MFFVCIPRTLQRSYTQRIDLEFFMQKIENALYAYTALLPLLFVSCRSNSGYKSDDIFSKSRLIGNATLLTSSGVSVLDRNTSVDTSSLNDVKKNLIADIVSRWEASPEALNLLPLEILLQLKPSSPITLIGCPENTVAFDLKTCTSHIIAETSVEGTCVFPSSFYDKERKICVIPSSAKPYILCPRGYRITLPPKDITRGNCEHSEIVNAIPHCDYPYELSSETGKCVLRRASLGYIGCRPGELRVGKQCLVAYQQLKEVHCLDGYETRLTEEGFGECLRTVSHEGSWNVYTQKPVCPSSTHDPIVSELPQAEYSANSVSNTLNLSNTVVSKPIVSCVETRKEKPLAVLCPNNTKDYFQYIRDSDNFPPVQISEEFGDPHRTCVMVDQYPIGPACPSLEQRIYINGTDSILDAVLHIITEKTNSNNIPNNFVLDNGTKDVSFPNRLLRHKSKWNQSKGINIASPKSIIRPLADDSITQKTLLNSYSNTRLETDLIRKAIHAMDTNSRSSITMVPSHSLYDVLVDVNWDSLFPADPFLSQLKSEFNIEMNDIDWVNLVLSQNISIICENFGTASFYLTCPKNFLLLKDGTCKGIGYTNSLILCPEGYSIDEVELMSGNYHHVKPVCSGYTPTATEYTCPYNITHYQNVVINGTHQLANNFSKNMNKTILYNDEVRQLSPRDFNRLLNNATMKSFNNLTNSTVTLTTTNQPLSLVATTKANYTHTTELSILFSTPANTPKTIVKPKHNITELLTFANHGSHNISHINDKLIVYINPNNYFKKPFKNSKVLLQNNYLERSNVPERKLNALHINVNFNTTLGSEYSEENYSTSSTELFLDPIERLCYIVPKRVNAWFSPTPDIIKELYGEEVGGEFLLHIDKANRTGGSPFYKILRKQVENYA